MGENFKTEAKSQNLHLKKEKEVIPCFIQGCKLTQPASLWQVNYLKFVVGAWYKLMQSFGALGQ